MKVKRREHHSRLLLLLIAFEHVVEELQDELLLFLWQAFYFLKSSLKRLSFLLVRRLPGVWLRV